MRCTCVAVVLAVVVSATAAASTDAVGEPGNVPRPEVEALRSYPALIYIEGGPRQALKVATFEGRAPAVRTAMECQYVQTRRPSDSVFLLQASEHPRDRSQWTQTIYPGKQWSKNDKPCPQCGGYVRRGGPVDHKETS